MTQVTRRETRRERQLRQNLEKQRQRIFETVRTEMREGRSDGAVDDGEVQDEAERSETDIQTDLEFALLQMRSETLARIDEALDRLDAGDYGRCVECGEEITAERLKALPFAIRCRDCEDVRETRASGHAHVSITWPAPVQLLDLGD
jgi:DnaK suppressor protein